MKSASFEELTSIYWKVFNNYRLDMERPEDVSHDAALRAVLAAIPESVTLPDDETLGRIANEASWPEGRKFPSDREVGAAIRAKLTGVSS